MDPATITATAAAIASTIGLLITSLRKRQDTTVEELRAALLLERTEHNGTKTELAEEREFVAGLRTDLRKEQDASILKDRIIAILRRTLAIHDLTDPSREMENPNPEK